MNFPRSVWFAQESRFPVPDWEAIGGILGQNVPQAEISAGWGLVARKWCSVLAETLGHPHEVFESDSFILVAAVEDRQAAGMLDFLETTRKQALRAMPFTSKEALLGKGVVFVFADNEQFIDYLAAYTEEDGEFAAPGGVFLNRGYGHFVVPGTRLESYADVFAHELCHMLLSHLELPLWLDEAITATMENDVTGRSPYVLDREWVRRHQAYWTPEKLEGFWSGESFWYPDEGHELSYHLARFLFNGIAGAATPEEMNTFVREARQPDAGYQAASEVLGIDLREIVEDFVFGEPY